MRAVNQDLPFAPEKFAPRRMSSEADRHTTYHWAPLRYLVGPQWEITAPIGLTVEQTARRARLFERNVELLPDSLAVHEEWRRLPVAHSESGVQVDDAGPVAALHVSSVPTSVLSGARTFAPVQCVP